MSHTDSETFSVTNPTFSDGIQTTDLEQAAANDESDDVENLLIEDKDSLHPLRILQQKDSDNNMHTPLNISMKDLVKMDCTNEPENVPTEMYNPLQVAMLQVTAETQQSPCKESVAKDTDSFYKNAAESVESISTPIEIQDLLEQQGDAESSENLCTFIESDLEDSPPPAVEEIIEKIMPKEDREMYKAVIECMVSSDEKKCCSCKHCFSFCCFSVSCVSCNPANICKGGTEVKNIITEQLQVGAQKGWDIFKELAFPTMRPFFRDLIAISEFLIGLLGLILSLISFSLRNNAGYNIFHITLAGFATILGLIDTVTSLKYSAAFKEAWKRRKTRECCSRQAADTEQNNEPTANSPRLPRTSDQDKCDESDSHERRNEIHDSRETSIVNIQNRNEPNWLKRRWDMGRLVIVELIFYPLLICDLIEFIVDKGYRFEAENAADILGFVLVIHSFVSQVFYVYILRLVVLISTIVHIQKKRTLSQDKLEKAEALVMDGECYISKFDLPESIGDEEDDRLNRDIASNGAKFQSYFVFHVAGQMAAQILMIVAISITIHKDNVNKTLDDSLHISSRLWFMIVAGYVFPFIGIVSFFIPTFYWTYEHPNGICINLLSMLEAPGIGHVLMFDEDTKDVRSKVTEIAEHLNEDQLKEDFCELRDRAFSTKLFYPFKSPLLVIVCLVYSVCQFAFLLTAIIAIRSGDPGTLFFYVFTIAVGIVANVYVFAVAAFWTFIIVGILTLIALVIAFIVLLCVLQLLGCFTSDSSQRR